MKKETDAQRRKREEKEARDSQRYWDRYTRQQQKENAVRESRAFRRGQIDGDSVGLNQQINRKRQPMKVTIDSKAKTMTIVIPINDPPVESSTGRTLSVASSHGNKETEVKVNGLPVYVGLNAYIYKTTKGDNA